MPSVLSSPKSRAQLGKKGFPMSHKFKFTASTGMLLPVLYDQLNPNEKISVKFDLFTRTQAVLTPAMIDCDEFIDVFFVPFGRVSLNAEDSIMNINDIHSSLIAKSVANGVVDESSVFPLYDDFSSSLQDQWINGRATESPFSIYGERFDSVVQGYLRLAEHLGFNPYSQCSSFSSLPSNSEDGNHDLDPILFYVYQSIYYDYYRLSNWEKFESGACNVDAIVNQYGINNVFKFSDLTTDLSEDYLKAFILRYRPYQRDYFKAIEPSPLIQSLGLMDTQNMTSIQQWMTNIQGLNAVDYNGSPTNEPFTTVNARPVDAANNPLNAATIRSMFAVDKMLRAIGQNGKHYDDQVLARFGFEVPHDVRHEIKYLGRHVQRLHIGEVISTADSGTSSLGDLAGRGYSKGSSDSIKYTAPCHGFLMAIYSCVPRITYVPGVDKFNTMFERFHYYQPELDELGLQPLFGYEMYDGNNSLFSTTSRIGWQPRYMQLKCKYDRATRAFLYGANSHQDGMYNDWTLAFHGVGKLFYTSPWNNTFTNLLCSPMDLNPIFVKQYALYDQAAIKSNIENNISLPNIIYANDNLINDLTISYTKTSTMSTFGIEDL